MLASIIAYAMSVTMLVLVAACLHVALTGKIKSGEATVGLVMALIIFGVVAWGFAKLGGM